MGRLRENIMNCERIFYVLGIVYVRVVGYMDSGVSEGLVMCVDEKLD